MKKVYKYATGAEIPEGAKYLWSCKNGTINDEVFGKDYKYVWHYFLVEVNE